MSVDGKKVLHMDRNDHYGGPPLALHLGGNPGAKLKSMSRRCCPRKVAFELESTEETIHLPLGCLQGGQHFPAG